MFIAFILYRIIRHRTYMHKRKTLEQKRLFQGHCDLMISKQFSTNTPHYYLKISARYSTRDNILIENK